MTIRAQLDSTVRCPHCRKESAVSFAACLRDGWPECCGSTMLLEHTDADVERIVKQAVAGARQTIRRAFEVRP